MTRKSMRYDVTLDIDRHPYAVWVEGRLTGQFTNQALAVAIAAEREGIVKLYGAIVYPISAPALASVAAVRSA